MSNESVPTKQRIPGNVAHLWWNVRCFNHKSLLLWLSWLVSLIESCHTALLLGTSLTKLHFIQSIGWTNKNVAFIWIGCTCVLQMKRVDDMGCRIKPFFRSSHEESCKIEHHFGRHFSRCTSLIQICASIAKKTSKGSFQKELRVLKDIDWSGPWWKIQSWWICVLLWLKQAI